MIISNMNEESKVFEKDIKILEEKIQDKVICQKIYNAVRTPMPENSDFRGMCCFTQAKSADSNWLQQ